MAKAFFGAFWPKKRPRSLGSGPGSPPAAAGVFGRLVCPFLGFLAKIGAFLGVIYHRPSAPFLGPKRAVCPTIFGHFGPKIVGAQKSWQNVTFWHGALFWCWSGVSFLAFGPSAVIGLTCRVFGQNCVGNFHFLGQNTTRQGCRRFFGLKKGQNYHRLGDFGS